MNETNVFTTKYRDANKAHIPNIETYKTMYDRSINNPDKFIDIPSSFTSPYNQYFALKVKGLSMIDNGIYDGDIAIIKKTTEVQNGKIAAVLTIENEITLKAVKIQNNKIHLIPGNKNYQEKVFNLTDVQVQGVLSGLIRKYN